jgi:hypothetical protein
MCLKWEGHYDNNLRAKTKGLDKTNDEKCGSGTHKLEYLDVRNKIVGEWRGRWD